MKKQKKLTKPNPRRKTSNFLRRAELSNIRVGFSPLANELHIYRHGANPYVALERRPATAEIFRAVMDYIFNGMEDAQGVQQVFDIGEDSFQVTVLKLDKETRSNFLHAVRAEHPPVWVEGDIESQPVDIDVEWTAEDHQQESLPPPPQLRDPKISRPSTRESPSPSVSRAPSCCCAGPNYDPDTPCPVPGHGKSGPYGLH